MKKKKKKKKKIKRTQKLEVTLPLFCRDPDAESRERRDRGCAESAETAAVQTAQRECVRRARESLSLIEAGAERMREAEVERVCEVRQSQREAELD